MMEFKSAELLHDKRVECASFMTSMTVEDYLEMVSEAYKDRGGISGQRDPLKTTSAKRIRKRMVEDLLKGAVLPPVVIGKVVNSLNGLVGDVDAVKSAVTDEDKNKLSIIDGMQRTTALLEALEEDKDKIKDHLLRVEFWIAKETESLIYRMLVLNTGQVPWNLSRQLQVVYAPLISEMQEKITFDRVLDIHKKERRTKAGQYRPDDLAELFIAFGLRKTDVDTKETLADEFSRLDMAEALSSHLYKDFFYPTIQMMVDLDLAFSRLDDQFPGLVSDEGETDAKQLVGRSIFDSKPARIGFVVAIAIAVMGRIGMEKDKDPVVMEQRIGKISEGLKALCDELASKDAERLKEFLKLGVLQQKLYGQKRSAVGRYERAFFEDAFKILIEENFKMPSLETCWRG